MLLLKSVVVAQQQQQKKYNNILAKRSSSSNDIYHFHVLPFACDIYHNLNHSTLFVLCVHFLGWPIQVLALKYRIFFHPQIPNGTNRTDATFSKINFRIQISSTCFFFSLSFILLLFLHYKTYCSIIHTSNDTLPDYTLTHISPMCDPVYACVYCEFCTTFDAI